MSQQVNQYSFLRWFNYEISTEQPQLPRPYQRDRGACPYMPIAYPTEAFGFYINAPDGFELADFDIAAFGDLRLDIVNAVTGVAVTDIAPLQQHDLGDDKFSIYATGVYPPLANGQYYFRIWNGTEPVLFSNNVYARNDKANLDRETVFVRFRHDRFFFHIRYQELPGFYQQFRLHLNELEEQFETEIEEYKAVTTGKRRRFQDFMNKYHKIEAYYFDKEAHEAAAVMTDHSYLEINGRQYQLKEGYKKSENPQSVYAKAEFEVWDEEFASVNRC